MFKCLLLSASAAVVAASIFAIPVLGLTSSTVSGLKTAGACNDEYKANKGALKDAKEKKGDFIKACRALSPGTPTPIGTVTTASPSAPISPTAAPQAPAQRQTQAPAPSRPPVQAPTTTGDTGYAHTPGNPTSTHFASEASAKGHCPSDTVVWVNTKSHVYHYAGQRNYAHTKTGAFECEAEAKSEGDRATKNGQ